MLQKYSVSIVCFLSVIFLVISTICLVKEVFIIYALPIVLFVLLLALLSLDKLLLIIVFFTPLSVSLTDIGMGIGMNLPTEPILFGILVLLLLKYLIDNPLSKDIITHPFSIIIYFYLAWMLICSVTSQDMLVSFKFFISKLWYILPFYFFIPYMLNNYKSIVSFYTIYTTGLMIVIVYTIINHSNYGFDQHSSGWVMTPFFRDHTSYGATLAMMLFPVSGISLFYPIKGKLKWFLISAFFVLLLGLFFSYTRAAWLSVIGSLGVGMLMYFKVQVKTLFFLLIFICAAFVMNQDQIFMFLEKNNQDSSDNITEHIQSISNISTDASNLERINRWKSGIRMFKEKPVFGWGPGTYQFFYASYQHPNEKTIISTNAADRGNAHSEYIGALAESGLLGSILFSLLVLIVGIRSVNMFYKTVNEKERVLIASTLLGLVTYFIHALFNNFLDMDKVSVLFWAMISILMILDLKIRGKSI